MHLQRPRTASRAAWGRWLSCVTPVLSPSLCSLQPPAGLWKPQKQSLHPPAVSPGPASPLGSPVLRASVSLDMGQSPGWGRRAISCSAEAAQASGSSCWGVSSFGGVLSPLVSPDTLDAVMNTHPEGCAGKSTGMRDRNTQRRRLAWGGPKNGETKPYSLVHGVDTSITCKNKKRHINNM